MLQHASMKRLIAELIIEKKLQGFIEKKDFTCQTAHPLT